MDFDTFDEFWEVYTRDEDGDVADNHEVHRAAGAAWEAGFEAGRLDGMAGGR